MKVRLAALALALSALFVAMPAKADDAVSTHQIANVTALPAYATEFSNIRFYFGNASHPSVTRRIEADVTTSLRTRKLGRSSEEACQWVLMSALIQLRDHAVASGGNAVINIRSNWRNQEWSSATEYQCAAGFLMAGVALKGDVVALR
jgi:uncharacterized protein YbjQ (UPF0145 family)